uniref:Immunoglobulin subtype domain-containing protein n=1 Tax=Fundulus heteroclitus TaxID=8078 RepID=A0A3Q2NXH4_FUNHE
MSIFSFICLFSFTGSTSVNHVFVQTGEDLILNLTEVTTAQNSDLWLWQFNGKAWVKCSPPSPPIVKETHTGRIEVLEKTYNVKLKNLHKSDSGIYTARSVQPKDQKLTEYNVTVQDPVSQPDLYIDSVSSSSSSCNFTATCRTEDSSIRSSIRCDNKICHQDEGKRSVVTQSGASLHMFLSYSSIICNSSNQVSWSEKIVEIQHFCRHCSNKFKVQHCGPITTNTSSESVVLFCCCTALKHHI